MPELPEAETIVRTLGPRITGRRIVQARFLTARVCSGDPAELAGRAVREVRRYGKQVLWMLDRGCLRCKLGMTGALLAGAEPGPYTRAVITLAGVTVLFDDIRQFGSIRLLPAPPGDLGPDPLEIDGAEFAERLRSRDTAVKTALLDQSFVRGIGNIYADECLFRARLDPRARTRRLSPRRALRLYRAAVELLEEAIECRGSSISDYVDAAGERGSFQLRHRVYGREGEPCVCCGAAVRRIVFAQRGTHFCPRCQQR